jgi:hypothetical protein
MWSVRRRRIDPSTAHWMYSRDPRGTSGTPSTPESSSPNLVASTNRSRRPAMASPSSDSLAPPPP